MLSLFLILLSIPAEYAAVFIKLLFIIKLLFLLLSKIHDNKEYYKNFVGISVIKLYIHNEFLKEISI